MYEFSIAQKIVAQSSIDGKEINKFALSFLKKLQEEI